MGKAGGDFDSVAEGSGSAGLKILQLVSDWKWTGPAEPMLVLMEALRGRGHQVDLVCPEPPSGANRNLWQEATARRLDPIHPILPLRRVIARGDAERAGQLRSWLGTDELAGPYDVVHCWHSRDHVLAARALRLGMPGTQSTPRTQLVRFLSRAERIPNWPWNRWLFGPACDGLVCVSDRAVAANRRMRPGRSIAATSGAIDFEALDLRKDRRAMRHELGVAPDAVLVGVVARMQVHRRFDLLLDALARVVVERPELVLLLMGRGSREEEVVRRPVREKGLEKNVVFAGYRVEDYADVLGALDAFSFLVPGSDGTCRALLQAAALGLPLVGTRRGAIPEIISNGQTGLLVAEEAEDLAAAWVRLIDDPEGRREMGRAAARDASERFRPDRFAAWMERFYADLMKSK